MNIISAILVALIATCSTWWFSHTITRTWLYPLWSGFLVGIAMGKPVEGMMIAASINLPYVGFITAGGSMPGNPMFAGPVGTALALASGLDTATATTVGVVLGSVAILTWNAYMTLNVLWVHMADKYAEQGNLKMVRFFNYVPSFFVSLILNGVPAFLVVMYGSVFGDWLANFPPNIVQAFEVVGALMPALGIGMLLNYIGKTKIIPFFFAGFFMTIYFDLGTMAIAVFAAIVGIVMFNFTKDNGTKGV